MYIYAYLHWRESREGERERLMTLMIMMPVFCLFKNDSD